VGGNLDARANTPDSRDIRTGRTHLQLCIAAPSPSLMQFPRNCSSQARRFCFHRRDVTNLRPSSPTSSNSRKPRQASCSEPRDLLQGYLNSAVIRVLRLARFFAARDPFASCSPSSSTTFPSCPHHPPHYQRVHPMRLQGPQAHSHSLLLRRHGHCVQVQCTG